MTATIEEALQALRQGRPVLVLDDHDRENEGDVVLAGATLTDRWCAWAIRHTSGYLCAPLTNAIADRLDLPLMVARNEDRLHTAYTVTVDAREGVTTGISAADRASTIRRLAAATTTPADLVRPGHVVPLRARDGGVLTRRGHTEATVDLCRLAGLPPVGVIAELVHDDGPMMRADAVIALGTEHGLPVVAIADLVDWRLRHGRAQVASTGHGDKAASLLAAGPDVADTRPVATLPGRENRAYPRTERDRLGRDLSDRPPSGCVDPAAAPTSERTAHGGLRLP